MGRVSWPPPSLVRRAARLPVGLFRLRLGWVFGGRLVAVEHIGRRTGKRYDVVLEVVARDGASLVVAAGFGARSDWYRNLLACRRTRLRRCGGPFAVDAEPLSPEEGGLLMDDYARRHPRTARRLVRLLGLSAGASADFAAIGREIPFLRLRWEGRA